MPSTPWTESKRYGYNKKNKIDIGAKEVIAPKITQETRLSQSHE